MKKQLGFTLIELMIVVVVVAILTSVAYPSYTDYVTRGRIPEATSALADKRIQMEQWFQDNRTYAGAPACTSDTTTSQLFTFSCTAAATATAYTLQAVGRGSMTGFSYTINQGGTKTSGITRSGWSNPSPNNCWAIRRDGSCS